MIIMRKKEGTFFNRRAFVALSVMLSLAVFGIVGWQAQAQIGRDDRDISGLHPTKQARFMADREDSGYSMKSRGDAGEIAAPQGGTTIIWGYDFFQDRLFSFNANTPGTILTDIALTGLDTANGEFLNGIDFRPSNGQLYAVASKGFLPGATDRVVTINTTTGAVTSVGGTVATPTGLFQGIDFNPVPDAIRQVTDTDVNRRLNPNDGSLIATDSNINPATNNIVHVAYNRNAPNLGTNTLYGIDTLGNNLVIINPPNAGTVQVVGPLGVDPTNFGGFDIQQGTGLAYAVLFVGGVSNLYTINLATGAATLVGAIGDVGGAAPSVDGMSIAFSATGGSANLGITKTGPATYTAGSPITYTIVASNAGPDPVQSAIVSDTFPAAVTGVTYTCTGTGGGVCSGGTGNINNQVDLPSGGSVTYVVTGTVAPGTSGNVANTASIATPAGVTDPTPANNSATTTATGPPAANADLGITKTDNQTTYTPGGVVTYVIVASNAGPSPVVGATVTDNFPAQVSSASWTCSGAGGGTCPASGNGNINAAVNLPVGATATFTVTANISPNATGNLVNTATITAPAGVTDANQANNSATDTDTAGPVNADLGITKTDGQTTYAPGSQVSYTIVGTNTGPAGVFGARIQDTFPSQVTGASFTCTPSGGATCSQNNGVGNINTLVNLPVGSSVTIVATVNISPNATGNLVNTATITAPAGVTDANQANNSATDTDTLRATAAGVEISGRVFDANGRGLRNAVVAITDENGVTRTVTTSSFGYYRFENVDVGETYLVTVRSKRFRFETRAITVSDSISGVDFVGQE